MPLSNWITKGTTKVWEKYADEPAKGLLHLGAVGWVLSCIAQTFMLVTSKDIDADKKKFLIPQELTDGVVNVGLYYTITAAIKKFADSLVEKGHIIGDKTYQFIIKYKNNAVSLEEYIKAVSNQFDFEMPPLEKPYRTRYMSGYYNSFEKFLTNPNFDKIQSGGYDGIFKDGIKYFDTKEKAEDLLEVLKDSKKEFEKLKNFTSIMATIIGSVIASSIIVPIVRNRVANEQQKKTLEKNQKPNPQLQYMQIYKTPTSGVFSKLTI